MPFPPPQSIAAEKALMSCLLQKPGQTGPLILQQWPSHSPFAVTSPPLRQMYAWWKREGHPLQLSVELLPSLLERDMPSYNWYETIASVLPAGKMWDLPSYIEECYRNWQARALLHYSERAAQAAASLEVEEASSLLRSAVSVTSLRNTKWEQSLGDDMLNILSGSGLSVPIPAIRGLVPYIEPGQVLTIGARPGSFKTLFAQHILMQWAQQGVPVGMFSMEMSERDLKRRALTSLCKCTLSELEGYVKAQYGPVVQKASEVALWPFSVYYKPGLYMDEVESVARVWKEQHDIQAIAIDYFQLMATKGDHTSCLNNYTARIKTLAKELGIVIINVVQLNRGSEQEERAPRKSDAKGAGGIEQDSDIILLVWRDKRIMDEGEETEGGPPRHEDVSLIVDKNRNGPEGRRTQKVVPSQGRIVGE